MDLLWLKERHGFGNLKLIIASVIVIKLRTILMIVRNKMRMKTYREYSHIANFTPHTTQNQPWQKPHTFTLTKNTHQPLFRQSPQRIPTTSLLFTKRIYYTKPPKKKPIPPKLACSANDALDSSIYQLKVVKHVIERRTNKPTPSNTILNCLPIKPDGQPSRRPKKIYEQRQTPTIVCRRRDAHVRLACEFS